MSTPLISVIIPCYKQAQYLGHAIESVLAQTYSNVEIIVVNDSSPDNTSEVARAYPGVRLLEQENTGVSAARNNALKLAQGQYIQFVDADDWLHPDKLTLQVEYMEANPHIGLSFTDFYMVYPDGTVSEDVSVSDHVMPIEGEELFNQLWLGNIFPLFSALVRKEWIEDFIPGHNKYEDYELWLRLSAKGCRMHYINARMAYYRKHPQSSSTDLATMHKGLLVARAVTAASFPEKVSEATYEVVKTFAEILEAKNAWSSRREKDFEEISTYRERLEANQASQQNYISELETAVAQKNAHIQTLEQRLRELEESKANNLINRIKKLKG